MDGDVTSTVSAEEAHRGRDLHRNVISKVSEEAHQERDPGRERDLHGSGRGASGTTWSRRRGVTWTTRAGEAHGERDLDGNVPSYYADQAAHLSAAGGPWPWASIVLVQ